MDRETGRIYNEEELKKMFGTSTFEQAILNAQASGKKFIPLDEASEGRLARAMMRKPPRVGRNEKCPCGSGKKFKKCCLVKQWKERYGR